MAATGAIPGPQPGGRASLHQLDQGSDDLLLSRGAIEGFAGAGLGRGHGWQSAGRPSGAPRQPLPVGRRLGSPRNPSLGGISPQWPFWSFTGPPSAEEGAIVGKQVKASMAIAIELSDHQAQALSEAASRLQVPEAELAAAAVRDLLAHQSADFDAAAQRVLEKNQELYRRLA